MLFLPPLRCGLDNLTTPLRDLVEMMAERGVSLAHTTILRWVQRYTPKFVKRWNRF
jgi:transposase-like protein